MEKKEIKKVSFRLPQNIYTKLKDITYWNRVTMGSFILEALQSHIGQYERERGEPYPKRK